MAVIGFLPQEQWLTLDVFLRKNPEADIEAMVKNRLEEARDGYLILDFFI